MPELPEVETTRRGIAPHIEGNQVSNVIIRQPRLRWPIPAFLPQQLIGHQLIEVSRRAKYLLLHFNCGCLLIHLGMSGSLRIITTNENIGKHDHIDIIFANNIILRMTDPRRFGAVLWLGDQPDTHPLLSKLGPEPLTEDFCGKYLYAKSWHRKRPVKQFIMDQQIVTGVGNIYASEALFASGIRPARPAGNISLIRYEKLAFAITKILTEAIARGGTTLRDFVGSDGKPGYFKQQLNVYGKSGLPCPKCQRPLAEIKLANRSSVFCKYCQR